MLAWLLGTMFATRLRTEQSCQELEGSTDGSAPIDAVDDETVQTESEVCRKQHAIRTRGAIFLARSYLTK